MEREPHVLRYTKPYGCTPARKEKCIFHSLLSRVFNNKKAIKQHLRKQIIYDVPLFETQWWSHLGFYTSNLFETRMPENVTKHMQAFWLFLSYIW